MTERKRPEKPLIITATWILLAVYGAFYWSAKFFRNPSDGILHDFYSGISPNWYIITFLEFLAVVSLAVDLVIRWDRMSSSWRKTHLIFTTLLGISFVSRVILGMMDLFLTGQLR